MPDIVEDACGGSERAAVPSRFTAERRQEAETALEEARVRAYRETRIWEPNTDTYSAAVAVYEAAFGPWPQTARQDNKDDSETLSELPPKVIDAFDVIAQAVLSSRREVERAYVAGQTDLMVQVKRFCRPCDVVAMTAFMSLAKREGGHDEKDGRAAKSMA